MNGGPAAAFEDQRHALFALAYRMLGSVADAEDVVQEAWVRYDRHAGCEVRSPPAFLTTIVTRLCIDELRSARARREAYVGPWLPEPLPNGADAPAESAVLSDTLSLAFLALLEELTPLERAAFLLHDVFGHTYDEIAGTLERRPAACRQLVSRARHRIRGRRRRFDADRAHSEELTRAFLAACGTGDSGALVALLTDDVVVWTDGGGRVRAAVQPVRGAERAARFLLSVARRLPSGAAVHLAPVNGQPGIVILHDGRVTGVVSLAMAGARIAEVRVVTNPDKLRAGPPARAEPEDNDAGDRRRPPPPRSTN